MTKKMRDFTFQGDVEDKIRKLLLGNQEEIRKFADGIHDTVLKRIRSKIEESISKVEELEESILEEVERGEETKESLRRMTSTVKQLQEILSEVEKEVRSIASDITPRRA